MLQGDEGIEEARQHAKIANFGLPGGMGVRGLIGYAKGYGVTLNEIQAATLKREWLEQWPEMRDYFKYIGELVGKNGDNIVNIPQSGFQRGGMHYCDACNTFFQALAAHASKTAHFNSCQKMYNDRDSWLYGSRPVNFVHDESMIETREEFVHEAAIELCDTMVASMQKFVPDIPCSATASAMRNWSKKAKPVYINRRLVPWEDARKEAA